MTIELTRTELEDAQASDSRPITVETMEPGDQIDGQVWYPDIERDTGPDYRALVQIGLSKGIENNTRHVPRLLGKTTLRAGDLVRAVPPLTFEGGRAPTVNDVELVEVIATYEQIKTFRVTESQD
jgi:hypothetical protein